jgi:uncharacterized protein
MKTTIVFNDNHNNSYWSDFNKKKISLCHPIFAKTINDLYNNTNNTIKNRHNFDEKEDYYIGKYLFLKKNGFFNEEHRNEQKFRLTSNQIKYELANTRQIVFEVTDSCNLNCKYCFYGDLYMKHCTRKDEYMKVEHVIPFLSYMDNLWNSSLNNSSKKSIYISFYGGEPLLNINFISNIVKWFRKRIDCDRFKFSMTTNGILLSKHMNFLVENNFHLLISLDGNKANNQYRVNRANKNPFDQIHKQIVSIKNEYPDFFNKNVNINAVLHNANSVDEIYNYIKSEYNKIPMISEINDIGISSDKKNEYNKMYRSIHESLGKSDNHIELERELFSNLPSYLNRAFLLHIYSGYVYRYYDELIKHYPQTFHPTGTCLPFSRKVFITVNGKILPCETVSHQYSLGIVDENGMKINYKQIASKYNDLYNKIECKCNKCYRIKLCKQCLLKFESMEKTICHGFWGIDEIKKYFSEQISFLSNQPTDYKRIMDELIIE